MNLTQTYPIARPATPVSLPIIGRTCPKTSTITPKSKTLALLPLAIGEKIHAQLQPVSFKPGNTIYHPEDLIDYVYFPETCVASRLSLMEDGSTVEIGIIGNEGIIGITTFVGATIAHNWTVVEIGGTALRIRAGAFRELLRTDNDLRSVVGNYYNSFFMQVSQRAVCRSRHTLMEQLCSWLLMVKDRVPTNQLPLTHEAIARRLGTRRAGITVAANNLRKEEIIDYARGHIVICDYPKLEAFACECYNTLKSNLTYSFGGSLIQ